MTTFATEQYELARRKLDLMFFVRRPLTLSPDVPALTVGALVTEAELPAARALARVGHLIEIRRDDYELVRAHVLSEAASKRKPRKTSDQKQVGVEE